MSSRVLERVALFGRPNVGKSTLFNSLTRTRKALVKNEPGVTRDLLIERALWWGREFEVVDTGGVTESKDGFAPLIREKVLSSLHAFDLLVVILDGRAGLMPEDRDIVRMAKESGKKFLLVVNKIDKPMATEQLTADFYEFGMDFITASFENSYGVDQIVEWILANMDNVEKKEREGLKITIIGKPNVGKSSLCNVLLGESRQLVSDQVGTTVDAVEVPLTVNGKPYILVDTAGVRRQARRKDGVEFISAHMSEEAVRRSDLVFLVIDANEGPSGQDVKLVELCLDTHKAVILVGNKMDLSEDKAATKQRFQDMVDRHFRFFPDLQSVFVSVKEDRGMRELFNKVEVMAELLRKKITTSKLNNFFFDVIRRAPSPVWGTVNVKFYYLVQTEQVPPSFIAFANHPQGVTPAYRRFLSKQLKEEFGLIGVPVRIFVMPSHRDRPHLEHHP